MSDYETNEFTKLKTLIVAANQNVGDDEIRIETKGINPRCSMTIKAYVLEKFLKAPEKK